MDTFEQPETLVIEKVFRLDTFQEKGKTEAKLSSEGQKAESRQELSISGKG